jgi:hypothetical protein
MTARRKHRAQHPPPSWQYFYNGRDLVAVIEHRADGWHAILHSGNVDLGTFPSREQAIGRVNAHKSHVVAAPITRERAADADRLKTIRQHRKLEREQRARRAVGSKR